MAAQRNQLLPPVARTASGTSFASNPSDPHEQVEEDPFGVSGSESDDDPFGAGSGEEQAAPDSTADAIFGTQPPAETVSNGGSDASPFGAPEPYDDPFADAAPPPAAGGTPFDSPGATGGSPVDSPGARAVPGPFSSPAPVAAPPRRAAAAAPLDDPFADDDDDPFGEPAPAVSQGKEDNPFASAAAAADPFGGLPGTGFNPFG